MNVSSTLSAIYYIAEHAKYPVSKHKLEMMLYTADRDSIVLHGWTITEDSLKIIDGIPVLENLHDMLEGGYFPEIFNKLFTFDPDLKLIRPFTYDYLSINETELIQDACDKWAGKGEIYEDAYIHELIKGFPEMKEAPEEFDWIHVLKSCNPDMIPVFMDLHGMLDTDAEIDEMLSYIEDKH